MRGSAMLLRAMDAIGVPSYRPYPAGYHWLAVTFEVAAQHKRFAQGLYPGFSFDFGAAGPTRVHRLARQTMFDKLRQSPWGVSSPNFNV